MKEKISALMDGELDGRTAEQLVDELRRGGDCLEAWRTYHVVGDAMRDTRLLSEGFAARVAQRLAAEPTVLAARRAERQPRRWIALPAAIAASVAAVALVALAIPQGSGAPGGRALPRDSEEEPIPDSAGGGGQGFFAMWHHSEERDFAERQ